MITHHPPPPDLAHAMVRGWHIAPSGVDGTAVHEVGPSCGADLVFRLGRENCRLVLLGMRTKKTHVEMEGRSAYMGFRFQAGYAPRLTDLGFADMVDGCMEVEHLPGVGWDELATRMRDTNDPSGRLALLAECVRSAGVVGHGSRCLKAAGIIEERGGMLTVQQAAALAGVHPRSLERFFRRHFTITPKQFIRIARLNRAAMQLLAEQCESMAGVAQECGYADQAHMAREFRRMADITPRMISPEYTGRVDEDPPGEVHRYRK